VYFFSCIGMTGTGTGWFPGFATVPARVVWQPQWSWQQQTRCQSGGLGQPRGLEPLQSWLGGQLQTQCLSLHFPPFPFRALNTVEPQHVAVICVSLEFPGWQHTFSKYFTCLSGSSTCSGVRFKNTEGAHHSRYFPCYPVHAVPHSYPAPWQISP